MTAQVSGLLPAEPTPRRRATPTPRPTPGHGHPPATTPTARCGCADARAAPRWPPPTTATPHRRAAPCARCSRCQQPTAHWTAGSPPGAVLGVACAGLRDPQDGCAADLVGPQHRTHVRVVAQVIGDRHGERRPSLRTPRPARHPREGPLPQLQHDRRPTHDAGLGVVAGAGRCPTGDTHGTVRVGRVRATPRRGRAAVQPR